MTHFLYRLTLVCLFSHIINIGHAQQQSTLYIAKKIITMSDNDNPPATAIAVKNGHITAIGELDKLLKSPAIKPYKIDKQFKDKIILPGFIDNHLHPIMAAVLLPMHFITPFDWQLPNQSSQGVQSQRAYLAKLRQLESSLASQTPLFTWGYHHLFHGKINRALLDQISSTRPIIVWHRSFHEVYLNSAALKHFAFNKSTFDKHPQANWQQGHIFEGALSEIAIAKLSPTILSKQWISKGLELVRQAVHQGGITTIADMANGGFQIDYEWQSMNAVLNQQTTPFRTALIPLGHLIANDLNAHKQRFKQNNPRLFYLKQAKLLADGAFYSQLMQMQAPGYLDGHSGEWITPPKKLQALAQLLWQEDYQLHVHSNGDLGTKVVLDILENLQQKSPKPNHRFTLHHLGYIQKKQAQRIAKLNALVSANPYYFYTLADKYSQLGLGKERAEMIFRGRDLLDANVKLSLHSDYTMAPAKPLTLAWVASNRITFNGNKLSQQQRLSVKESLRAITIDAAYAIGMEKQIGSLEVGKKADFTILNQDPYLIAPNELKNIPIHATVFEGNVYPIADH